MGITSLAVLMIGAILFALTSAWYTNTIQANEITLKTAKWNFDGTITLDGEDNSGTLGLGDLYPGDTRLLPVTIQNKDTRGVNVRVEADKSKMESPEMQQRLYLYVEKTDENGVTTRHYINSLSGYLYTVAAGQTLHITDVERTLSANEAQNKNTLHLQWVYDMTGYFLLGTVTEKDGTITVAGKTADTQPEYLMPVTYDLDRAQFDADGKLSSVSEYREATENSPAGYGSFDRKNYLKTLFEQYAKEYNIKAAAYDENTKSYGNYYAVDVDANGYGVWLYLPDKTAIDATAKWDQETAKSENDQPISLSLVFKGQNQTTTTTGKEQQP